MEQIPENLALPSRRLEPSEERVSPKAFAQRVGDPKVVAPKFLREGAELEEREEDSGLLRRLVEIWEALSFPDLKELEIIRAWAGVEAYEELPAFLESFFVDVPQLLRALRHFGDGDIPALLRRFRRSPSQVPSDRVPPLPQEKAVGEGWRFGNLYAVEAGWVMDKFQLATLDDVELAFEENLAQLSASGLAYFSLVRCYSCGKVLGDLYEPFQRLAPYYTATEESSRIELLWDALGVSRYCCKGRLMAPPQLPRASPGWMPEGIHPSAKGERSKPLVYPTSLAVLTRLQYDSIVPDMRRRTVAASAAAPPAEKTQQEELAQPAKLAFPSGAPQAVPSQKRYDRPGTVSRR